SPWSRNLPISGGTSTPPKVLRVDSSASCEGDFRRRRDQLGKPTFSTTSTLELSGAGGVRLERVVRCLRGTLNELFYVKHLDAAPFCYRDHFCVACDERKPVYLGNGEKDMVAGLDVRDGRHSVAK